jgi:AcrR family transcriptional regulator
MPDNDQMPDRTAADAADAVAAVNAAAKAGLRERKKVRTRQAIRAAAFRLFAEHGYDATPVDRIAAGAEVSPSTVFRYFPTKEDIVLTDEDDEEMAELLRTRPLDEHPLESLRVVMHETMGRAMRDPAERAVLVQRAELVRDVPAIRAQAQESLSVTGRLLGGIIAARTGRSEGDLEIRVFTAAVFGALHEALLYWVEHGRDEELLDLLDRTLDTLGRGLLF